MSHTKCSGLMFTSAVFATAFMLSSASVFAQSAQDMQIAANLPPLDAPKTAADVNAPSALQARMDAQQREIDELKAMVTKLQATIAGMSQPVASTQPVLPPATPTNPVVPPVTWERSQTGSGGGAGGAGSTGGTVKLEASYRAPRELLPDIGQIGAEVGLFLGGSMNPYKDDAGFATGGYIDLPFKNFRSGKLSYEIMVGLQTAQTTQTSTSGVNILTNAVLNSYLGNTAASSTSPTSFLTGPLPITSTVQENSKVLTVAPMELKYTWTGMGRFRPYVVAGLGMYVWIGNDNNTSSFNAVTALGSLANAPVGSSTLGAVLNSILQGNQIGGLAPAAPQAVARGVPEGQGNLMFGGQYGAGFEVRVSPKYSIGLDVRRNQVEGTNASFTSFAFKQGLHW